MNRRPRVFVVQNQHRWNRDLTRFEPKYDLTPAEEFGELVHLLSPTAAPFRPEPIVSELQEKLAGYQDGDYLLLVGNPCLIGFAVAIAADYNDGKVSLLQWSGKDQRYVAVTTEKLFTSSD